MRSNHQPRRQPRTSFNSGCRQTYERPRSMAPGPLYLQIPADYLPAVASCDVTVLNVLVSCVPRPLTAAMMATEMPAAIKPYSMAVAPDSSFTKRLTRLFIEILLCTLTLSELGPTGAGCLPRPIRT